MTTQNQRDLPHPTLKPARSDYLENFFFRAEPSAIRRSTQAGEINIALKYLLNSPVLQDLIEREQAHYHTLTECIVTHLRESHRSIKNAHTIRIETKRYHGQVLIKPFIVASQSIENISNDDWKAGVKTLLPHGANVPSGAILAIGKEKSFDTDTTTELESYVEITPSQAVRQKSYKIDLSGQRIVILIHPEDKLHIDQVRQDENSLQALFPSMYQRAIEEAVRLHRKEEHEGKRWAVRIADKLGSHGLDSSDPEMLEANSLDYAQQIMDNPLTRIIESANRASEE